MVAFDFDPTAALDTVTPNPLEALVEPGTLRDDLDVAEAEAVRHGKKTNKLVGCAD